MESATSRTSSRTSSGQGTLFISNCELDILVAVWAGPGLGWWAPGQQQVPAPAGQQPRGEHLLQLVLRHQDQGEGQRLGGQLVQRGGEIQLRDRDRVILSAIISSLVHSKSEMRSEFHIMLLTPALSCNKDAAEGPMMWTSDLFWNFEWTTLVIVFHEESGVLRLSLDNVL